MLGGLASEVGLADVVVVQELSAGAGHGDLAGLEQNAQMALSIATRGYVLETGRITLTGSGEALLTNDAVRAAYLGA